MERKHRIKKIVLLAVILLISAVSVLGESITVTQSSEVTLYGGDYKEVNLTITYDGPDAAECKITSMIYPDGEGINVTYVPSEFSISSQQTVVMMIDTELALMPGDYIIETTVTATIPAPTLPGQHSKVTVHESQDEPPVDDEVQKPPKNNDTEESDDIVLNSVPLPQDTFNLWLLSPFLILPFLIIFAIARKKNKKERNK